ncbi:MAG: bifunctional 4-hydroxy-2-oxoglutarate aldolase/2-dehydro-3-deoxy-phosphogluconate aldolase [Halioglobus sp.]
MILSTLRECRVLPVVTAVDVDSTVQLARALNRGGMKAIEITLRSSAALDSILAVQQEVPEMLVAAGTVNTPAQLESVLKAGVKLALSPGATAELLRAAADSGVFFIPGAASASEVMQGMLYGFELFKFFPAEAAGGVAMLESLAGPFPQIEFCPTGGLNPANFRSYLALPNVVCCGGSWMVNSELISQGRWGEVEELARQIMIG